MNWRIMIEGVDEGRIWMRVEKKVRWRDLKEDELITSTQRGIKEVNDYLIAQST